MYIGIGQGPQHQTCTFEICNFHFHYERNVTSSGIQVKSMQNFNCTLKIVGKYYIRCVLYVKKCISQIVHLLLLLLPVEVTIICDCSKRRSPGCFPKTIAVAKAIANIWSIAGLIIILAKYSDRVARVMGNNSVPVLTNLFLLSYMPSDFVPS